MPRVENKRYAVSGFEFPPPDYPLAIIGAAHSRLKDTIDGYTDKKSYVCFDAGFRAALDFIEQKLITHSQSTPDSKCKTGIVYVHMMGDRVLGVHTNFLRLENALKANPNSDYTTALLDPKKVEGAVKTPAGEFRVGERLWFWDDTHVEDKAALTGIFHSYEFDRYGACDGEGFASYYDHCSREIPEHVWDFSRL